MLRQIGVRFRAIPADIDESIEDGEAPSDYVVRLSVEKARTIASSNPHEIVLGSDTIVVLDHQILGKPEDQQQAAEMLRRLSGATHTVLTGYALVQGPDENVITGIGRADVRFRHIEEDEIARYVAGGSPMDKAGSYGIQEDLGAVFIESIAGDYYTIVGLPLTQVYLSLRSLRPGVG